MAEQSAVALAQLPIQAAPRLGEGIDSYVRRLARANHLKPSYLHSVLSGPPFGFLKPRIELLAAVTGRPRENLEQALSDVGMGRHRYRTGPRRAHLAQNGLSPHEQLRNAARDEGLTIRDIANRYQLPRWLVRKALTSDKPLPLEIAAHAGPATRPLAPLIDSMMHADRGVREIWVKLTDHHDIAVSYAMLSYYIRARRRDAEWQFLHFTRSRKPRRRKNQHRLQT